MSIFKPLPTTTASKAPKAVVNQLAAPTSSDDASLGFEVHSLWHTSAESYLCVDATLNSAIWKKITSARNVFSQSRFPRASDDSTSGFEIGSQWLTLENKLFLCLNESENNAQWREITDTSIKSGFYDNASDDSIITYDNSTRTITLSPATTSYRVVLENQPFEITEPLTAVFDDIQGLYYCYLCKDPLRLEVALESDPLEYTDKAFVTYFIWNATDKRIEFGPCDERHGLIMDQKTHKVLHYAFGTLWRSGLAVTFLDIDGDGSSEDNIRISIEDGVIADEDIEASITNNLPVQLRSHAKLPIYYLDGPSGVPKRILGEDSPILTVNNVPVYNNFDGSHWVLTPIENRDYGLLHLIATTSQEEPVLAMLGQESYSSLSSASDAALDAFHNLVHGPTPPIESLGIATLVFQYKSNFSNSAKARFVSLDTGAEYSDLRGVSLGRGGASIASHNSLAGLQGGVEAERYHLDRASYNVAMTAAAVNAVLDDDVETGQLLEIYDDSGSIKAKKPTFFEEVVSTFSGVYYNMKFATVSETEALMIYRDANGYATATILTKTATHITLNTPLIFKSSSTYGESFACSYRASDQHVVIMFSCKEGADYKLKVISLQKTNTTLSIVVPEAELSSSNFSVSAADLCYDDTSDRFVAAYIDASNSKYATLQVINDAGSSFSIGTKVVYYSADSASGSVSLVSASSMNNPSFVVAIAGNGTDATICAAYSLSDLSLAPLGSETIETNGDFTKYDSECVLSVEYCDEMSLSLRLEKTHTGISDSTLANAAITIEDSMGLMITATVTTYQVDPAVPSALSILNLPESGSAAFIFQQYANRIGKNSQYTVINSNSKLELWTFSREISKEIPFNGFRFIHSPFDNTKGFLIFQANGYLQLREVNSSEISSITKAVTVASESGLAGDSLLLNLPSTVASGLSSLDVGKKYYLDLDGSYSTKQTEIAFGVAASSSTLILS